MVSRGLKRLRIVQNNVEDVPPPAVPPPDEVPIPMVVALTDRSESSDALSDGSTTDTVVFEGDSEAGAEEFPQSPVEEEVEFVVRRAASLRRAFASLDEVDPCAQFQQRAAVMRSEPKFLVGMFRNALKIALEEIVRTDDEVTQERGWKLFLMLPRMLLHRPPGGGQISKAKLLQRFQQFVEGHWTSSVMTK